MTIDQADIWLTIRQTAYGLPARASASEMWRKKLAPALDSGTLKAFATRTVVNRLSFVDVSVGFIFPPEQQPGAASAYIIGTTDNRAVLKPAGAAFSHEFVEWRDVTFAREDVLRLWPEPAWQAAMSLAAYAWRPPAELSNGSFAALGDRPRLPLMAVVRLLAFGSPVSPCNMEQMHEIANRMRAAKVLFSAARDGHVILFGALSTNNRPEQIEPFIFDVDHSLVTGDDTAIEPDLGCVSIERFVELRRDAKRERWRDVTVERSSLAKWIDSLVERKDEATQESKPSDDEARALIRTAIDQNGGFIGQEVGARIVRERYPGFNKKRAMSFVKELTHNSNPGPRGPRKNRAANRA